MIDNTQNGYERLEKLILEFQSQTVARFDNIDVRFEKIDVRLDKMDARFDAMDSRLDKMDARFDAVDSRLDKMDARFDAMDVRLDKTDARIDNLQTSVDNLRTAQAAFEYTTSKQLVALFDDREMNKEMASESYRILRKLELKFDEDVGASVAVDATIANHEKRIGALERMAM